MPASSAAPSTHGGNPRTFPVDGARLRALRQKHGLSREALAGQAGISASTVAKIEQQQRTRCWGRTLARLSDRKPTTKATYVQHADRFVRWLAGEVNL